MPHEGTTRPTPKSMQVVGLKIDARCWCRSGRSDSLRVLERQALSISGLGERFDRLLETERWEVHLFRVGFSEPQTAGFPEVPDGLRTKSQQPGADHVC